MHIYILHIWWQCTLNNSRVLFRVQAVQLFKNGHRAKIKILCKSIKALMLLMLMARVQIRFGAGNWSEGGQKLMSLPWLSFRVVQEIKFLSGGKCTLYNNGMGFRSSLCCSTWAAGLMSLMKLPSSSKLLYTQINSLLRDSQSIIRLKACTSAHTSAILERGTRRPLLSLLASHERSARLKVITYLHVPSL